MRENPVSVYDRHLDQGPANYHALTPLSFLERSASVYPDKTAVIHGETRHTYSEMLARAADPLPGPSPPGEWGPATRCRSWPPTCRQCSKRTTACR